GHWLNQRPPHGGPSFHRSTGRPPPDLRLPGGDRHRERTTLYRVAGEERSTPSGARPSQRVPGATDRNERDPENDRARTDGRPTRVRHHRPERGAALSRGHGVSDVDRWPDVVPPGKLRQLARGTCHRPRPIPAALGYGEHIRCRDPDAVGYPCARCP